MELGILMAGGGGGMGDKAAATGLSPNVAFGMNQGLLGASSTGSQGSGSSGAMGTNVPYMGTGVRLAAVDQQLQQNLNNSNSWLSQLAQLYGGGQGGSSGGGGGFNSGSSSVSDAGEFSGSGTYG